MIKKRVYGLDIMRCWAILCVLYLHSFYVFGVPLDNLFVKLTAFDGVAIFFVLSGFLIGGILIRTIEQKGVSLKSLWGFWVNRWMRTLPAYYFILLVLIIRFKFISLTTLKYVFFAQNIKTGFLDFFGESWSLAVEEWFYLITPPLAFLAMKRLPMRKAIPLVASFIIVMVNIFRIYKFHHYHRTDYDFWMYDIIRTVPTRLDSLMYGVLAAYLHYYRSALWTKNNNLFFAIGILLLMGNNIMFALYNMHPFTLYIHPTIIAIGPLFMLPKFNSIMQGKGVISKIVTRISLTSYSIYLMHGSVYFFCIEPLLPANPALRLIAFILWALGGGWLLYRTVERWGMRLREKVNAKKMVAHVA